MKGLTKYSRHFVAIVALLMAAVGATAQDDPTQEAVALFNHGQDLHEKGDLKGAIAEYEKALKILPEFPEAEYQRAVAELALGELVEAEASTRRAIEHRPDWPLPWGMLADILVRRFASASASAADVAKLRPEIQSVLTRSLELDPANAAALTAMVEFQIASAASPATMQATLAKVRAVTDGKMYAPAQLWAARAAVENALGDSKAASESTARALAADPKNVGAMYMSAELALNAGDIDRAKQIVRGLPFKASPSRTDILNARIAAAEGRFAEANALIDNLGSGNPFADELRRQIKAATTTDTAVLEKQLAADPKNTDVLNRLCSLFRRDDPSKALDYCRRASELQPTNMVPAAGYAAALVQAKQFPTAVAVLEKLIQLEPQNWTLRANYATALFQLKQYEAAIKQFEWLSNADPKAAAPYYFLAICLDQLEQFVDSLAAYEQYLRLADPVANKLEIEKVNLRLPILRRLVKEGKGKRSR